MIPAKAFILIGGKSKRFGSPKWKVVIDGKTVLDRIWGSCTEFENRFVVGKEKHADLNKPFIQDELKLNAPINGLYTALKNTKTDWNLLLSCDLPLVESDIFLKLWESRNEKCDAVIPIANGKMQVTCGFYHKLILSTMEHEIQKGNYSLFKLLEKLNPTFVEFGNDERFWNMNTKKDYGKILQYITEQD